MHCDPTRGHSPDSRHVLNKEDVMKRVRAIVNSKIPEDWEWKVEPFRRGSLAPAVSNRVDWFGYLVKSFPLSDPDSFIRITVTES